MSPESLTFGIGDAGKTTAPAELGRFGISGTVYMIGTTQVPGVPWVGANTQNESVIQRAAGPVTWRLESAQGPGKVAIFESGNLGQIVGNVWFAKPGDTHELALHTHVHPNWVFSAPGTYKLRVSETVKTKDGQTLSGATTLTFIAGGQGSANDGHFDLGAEIKSGAGASGGKQVVGRTASGKPCDLSTGQLAKTGTSSLTPGVAALGLGLILAGAGGVALRRQLAATKR